MELPSKRCCTCHRDLPVSAFNRRATAADGLQARCRECSSAWYQTDRAAHMLSVRRRNDRVRGELQQRLADYFSQHPCVDCGERDVRCLEFDHRDGSLKVSEVARMVAMALPWRRILAEIEKCDVRCANCHRRVTAQRGCQWRQAVYERAAAESAALSLARLERVFQRPSA